MIRRGIKSVCSLSPLLFTIYSEMRINIGEVLLKGVKFADD